MEHGKRKEEEAVLSNGKRQRDQELPVHGSIVLPDGPTVDFRERLAEPLGDAMMVVGGGAPSQARRLTVARVLPGAFKPQVMMHLSKIDSCPMLLPSYFPRPTPIQSEAISNDDMQLTVFDVVNFGSGQGGVGSVPAGGEEPPCAETGKGKHKLDESGDIVGSPAAAPSQ